MALAYEGNTDLAFDTDQLRDCGKRYSKIGTDLRTMATNLDNCLGQLAETGWTTAAGKLFYEMTQTNWKENIDKYAALMDTLNDILVQAVNEYDELVTNHIERTKLE